jgi:hypothetical protein
VWARQVCEGPARGGDCRGDADVTLLAAARGGADLAGLGELAEEIRRRTGPDRDGDDGPEDPRCTASRCGRHNGDRPARRVAQAVALDSSANTFGTAARSSAATTPSRKRACGRRGPVPADRAGSLSSCSCTAAPG